MENRHSLKWVKSLKKVQKSYMNSYHRSIKCSPNEAEKDKNDLKIKKILYKDYNKRAFKIKKRFLKYAPKLEKGMYVRIVTLDEAFRKIKDQNYTTEFFRIYKIIKNTIPVWRYFLEGEFFSYS